MELDIEINHINIRISEHHENTGSPTIVFLHESFGCIDHWKDFPFELGKKTLCNVLVYDRQGYGKSAPFFIEKRENDYLEKEADFLNNLLKARNLNQVILFGHSDGGSIALLAAAKYPERIKAVITEGAHVFVEEVTLKGIREAEIAYQNAGLKEKLSRYHGEKTDKVFRLWADTWLSEEFRNWNMESFLPAIKCPVLVMQGSRDEYGSMAQVEAIVNQAGGESQAFIPESGHTPHREAKEAVLSEVADFLNNIAPV